MKEQEDELATVTETPFAADGCWKQHSLHRSIRNSLPDYETNPVHSLRKRFELDCVRTALFPRSVVALLIWLLRGINAAAVLVTQIRWDPDSCTPSLRKVMQLKRKHSWFEAMITQTRSRRKEMRDCKTPSSPMNIVSVVCILVLFAKDDDEGIVLAFHAHCDEVRRKLQRRSRFRLCHVNAAPSEPSSTSQQQPARLVYFFDSRLTGTRQRPACSVNSNIIA